MSRHATGRPLLTPVDRDAPVRTRRLRTLGLGERDDTSFDSFDAFADKVAEVTDVPRTKRVPDAPGHRTPAPGTPVLPRNITSPSTRTTRALRTAPVSRSASAITLSPIEVSGSATVVSGGDSSRTSGMSSNPASDTSSGTRNPASRNAANAPTAITSVTANTHVGRDRRRPPRIEQQSPGGLVPAVAGERALAPLCPERDARLGEPLPETGEPVGDRGQRGRPG